MPEPNVSIEGSRSVIDLPHFSTDMFPVGDCGTNVSQTMKSGRAQLPGASQGVCAFVKQIVDSIATPIMVIDRQKRVVAWNPPLEKITGIQAKEMLGTNDYWRPFYPEQRPVLADFILNPSLEGISNYYPKAFFNQDGSITSHERFRTKNGAEISVAINAAPIRGQDGEVMAVVESPVGLSVVEYCLGREKRNKQMWQTLIDAVSEYLISDSTIKAANQMTEKLVTLTRSAIAILYIFDSIGDVLVHGISGQDSIVNDKSILIRDIRETISDKGHFKISGVSGPLFDIRSEKNTIVGSCPSDAESRISISPEEIHCLTKYFLCLPVMHCCLTV